MADVGMERSDVRLLLHHACAALDEADLWAGLAASARHFKAAVECLQRSDGGNRC